MLNVAVHKLNSEF